MGAANVKQELPAYEALEAHAADERSELLVERAIDRRDGHALLPALSQLKLLKTPVTFPRICTCSGYNGWSALFSG